ERRIVVLDEARERPVGSIGVNVACATAMDIRVIQVDIVWQRAQTPLPIYEVALEHQFQGIKSVKPRWVFVVVGIGDVGVECGKGLVTVVTYHLFHRYVDVLAGTRWLRTRGLIDNSKLKAIAEVDETLAMAVQVQVDAAMLVVIVRLWRAVRVREAD